ncbi:MAG: cation diffusion facilitator family transporter [Tissierellia bacterium]|nr:cation diffusion facilitator family transporter [Tissierellia bacterium]
MLVNKVLKAGNYGKKNEDREKIASLAGYIGLLSNVLLAILKIIIGFLSGSISVLADAINNVMDSTSSVITIIGVKMADLPSDEDHPYGHGRLEYITALAVSCIIIVVGVQFVKTSYERFRNPTPVDFHWTSFFILLCSIGVKFVQSRFNHKVGEAINSAPLKATSADSMGDVLVTSVVILSLLVGRFTTFPIDGLAGIIVSIFIIFSGLSLIRETTSALIGEAPSEEFVHELHSRICEFPHVMNCHDIILSSYGPKKNIVVVDVEFPYHLSLIEVHEIVDQMELELSRDLGIHLIIHVDPVGHESENEKLAGEILDKWIQSNKELISFHDLRILPSGELLVDITAQGHSFKTRESRLALRDLCTEKLKAHFPDKKIQVHIDLRYF